MQELMTLKEVAEYLRLSIHTLYKMVEQGRIPAMKAGSQWRFSKVEIDRWMREGAGRKDGDEDSSDGQDSPRS